MFKLDRDNANPKEMRLAVVETLQELLQTDETVVALDADLGSASGFTALQAVAPERFINLGIAEANMVGVAAGLSVVGFKPFLHTFGPFATRRVFDQLFVSGAYAHNTLNIYGSDPGFNAGPNGGTHTTWEDVALMRMIPNAVICDAADATQMAWILKTFAQLEGIHYVRGNRKAVRNLYAKGSRFQLGKGNLLKSGQDVLLISSGQLVSDALDAAEDLELEGISVSVIDMFTIKPLDVDLILQESIGKKAVVTFENHSITGGLGSAVAEVLADYGVALPLRRLGVDEEFGQVGSQDFLQQVYKLTALDVQREIQTLLQELSLLPPRIKES